MKIAALLLTAEVMSVSIGAQSRQPDWAKIDEETLRHFQAILKLDSTDPPGKEDHVVAYLKEVLEKDGIAVQTFAKEAHRPNLVARIKGTGKQRSEERRVGKEWRARRSTYRYTKKRKQ